MPQRYETWKEFKVALELRGVYLLPRQWRILGDWLFGCAVHEPFSDGDILFAMKIIKKIKSMSG